MEKKAIAWPAAGLLTPSRLACALAVCAASVGLLAGSAQAADPKQAREKIVELNKQALFFYESKDWQSAKESLTEALDIAEAANLENNNMNARTYVHLGAVYWVGFRDREAAVRSFVMAKKIRPDIQLTPLTETPELKSLFESASVKTDTASPFASAAPTRPTSPVATGGLPGASGGGEAGGPNLVSGTSARLLCSLPTIASPNRDLTIRCNLRPALDGATVVMNYRPRGVEAYRTQRMRRQGRGWYSTTLSRGALQKGNVQVYFEARDEADNHVASMGQHAAPSVVAVREPGSLVGGGGDEDPLSRIRSRAREERYEAGLHRMRAGSVWFGMGAGVGWGYVPRGNLEWQKNVKVNALGTMTGMLHLLPEIGYMVSDSFGLALQGRIEFIRQHQAMYKDPLTDKTTPVPPAPGLKGEPNTMASALLARVIGYLDLSSSGNLRLSYSGDIGGGLVRLPVKPAASITGVDEDGKVVLDYDTTIAKTDTRPVGMFLVGASIGLSWSLSRHFAIALNGRALGGIPNWGVVVESGLSAQVSFGVGRGPDALPEDEEDPQSFGARRGPEAPPQKEEDLPIPTEEEEEEEETPTDDS